MEGALGRPFLVSADMRADMTDRRLFILFPELSYMGVWSP